MGVSENGVYLRYTHQIHPNAILMRKIANKVVNCGCFQTQMILGNDPPTMLLPSAAVPPAGFLPVVPIQAHPPSRLCSFSQKWRQLVPANVSNVETKKRRLGLPNSKPPETTRLAIIQNLVEVDSVANFETTSRQTDLAAVLEKSSQWRTGVTPVFVHLWQILPKKLTP